MVGSDENAQKRGDWRRNANRKEKVCNLLRHWDWTQFFPVTFYLALFRIGEADNPGPEYATAKLFGDHFEAIGQWTTNLTSKSEVELTPFFAQVRECRQMFSECFEKESYPYTSSVSQDIQGTHMDRFSLLVFLEPEDDLAHTHSTIY